MRGYRQNHRSHAVGTESGPPPDLGGCEKQANSLPESLLPVVTEGRKKSHFGRRKMFWGVLQSL